MKTGISFHFCFYQWTLEIMHRRSQESGVISFPFARPVHFHLSVGSKGHKERVKKKKRKGGGGDWTVLCRTKWNRTCFEGRAEIVERQKMKWEGKKWLEHGKASVPPLSAPHYMMVMLMLMQETRPKFSFSHWTAIVIYLSLGGRGCV